MNPRLRAFLVGALFSVLAVWVGISLAQEKRLLASLLAGISVWAVVSWARGPLAEAWLLAFLVAGYLIGNRGFAQIMPFTGLPLLLGELGLAIIVPLVVLRGALQRTLPVQRDWLHGLLALWFALGAGRMLWDVRVHGLAALRDFAMVYYVFYFFSARALLEHASSRRMMHVAVLGTFALLPLTGILGMTFSEFFRTHLTLNGVPLIYYKGDLLATFLFTGFVLLVPRGERSSWREAWRWLAAIGSLVMGLFLLSRSSLVGLMLALGWLAWAGRWRPARTFAAVCVAGLLAVTVHSLLQKKDFTQTRAYAIYEAAVSIVDFSGQREYRSEMSGDKGDNNRFRLVWWRNVIEETATTSPLVGLGFGADLARGFLVEYYPTDDTEFTARSPHNIFLTTFGRMGALGALVLLAVYWVQARLTARTARAVRRGEPVEDAMALQASVWVILVSSCFGVVLEGPMGAIPFWVLLALAHQASTAPLPDEAPAVPAPAGPAENSRP